MANKLLQRNPSTLKLMRNADTGKLMRAIILLDACPPQSGQYTLTFSGVTECAGRTFPSDINGQTFIAPYVCNVANRNVFHEIQNGWHIQIECRTDISALYIRPMFENEGVWYSAYVYVTQVNFGMATDVPNIYVIGNCGNIISPGYDDDCVGKRGSRVGGYGGTCTYEWSE